MENFTLEQIKEALESSGYIHEQRVADRLAALGLQVEVNWIYTDSDEDKARELDVRAFMFNPASSGGGVAIELLIECKSATSPFILLAHDRFSSDKLRSPAHHAFPKPYYQKHTRRDLRGVQHTVTELRPAYDHFSLYDVDPQTSGPLICTQFCRVARDGKKVAASHSDSYNSLVLPLAKAAGIRKKRWASLRRGEGAGPVVTLVYPIALVGGRVLEARALAEDVLLTDVGFGTLVRKFERYIDGDLFLSFVSSRSLEQFLQEVVFPYADALRERIEASPEAFS